MKECRCLLPPQECPTVALSWIDGARKPYDWYFWATMRGRDGCLVMELAWHRVPAVAMYYSTSSSFRTSMGLLLPIPELSTHKTETATPIIRRSIKTYRHSSTFPPPNWYHRRSNLTNSPLRCQQIKLRSSIPRILNLQPHAQPVQVPPNRRRNRKYRRPGANNQ